MVERENGANTAGSGVFAGAPADGLKSGPVGGQGELLAPSADESLLEGALPFRRSTRMPAGGTRKGVPNRRSEAMRRVYDRLGLPHPMLAMGQLLREGVDGLRERLIAIDPLAAPPSALEVFDQYRKLMADLLPYLEGKAPVKTDDGREGIPMLVLGDLAAGRAEIVQVMAEGGMAIDDDLDQQFQQLTAKAAQTSHGSASHDAGQDADNAGQTGDQAADTISAASDRGTAT